jgi:hypothetical protein
MDMKIFDFEYRRVHFKLSSSVQAPRVAKSHKPIPGYWNNIIAHPVWTDREINTIARTHPPQMWNTRTATDIDIAFWHLKRATPHFIPLLPSSSNTTFAAQLWLGYGGEHVPQSRAEAG